MGNGDYVESPRVLYPDPDGCYGDAQFVRVCEKCGRFVRADEVIYVSGRGLKDAPNATCAKCGRVKMLFEGFFW